MNRSDYFINKVGIILIGHRYYNDVQTMVQAFYPNMSYTPCLKLDNGLCVESILNSEGIYCRVYYNKVETSSFRISLDYDEVINKNNVKLTVFYALQKIKPTVLKWGTLTGIRPAKKVTEYFNQGLSDDVIKLILRKKYLIDDKKITLALEVSKKERHILSKSKDNDMISIYIGIPFCPAKCLYCSFTSYPVKKHSELVPDYVAALCEEIKQLSEKTRGSKVQTIYIGGGTPTALKASELFLILSTVERCFDLKEVEEFTVEAGRPDTLDNEKLKMIKDFAVTRISINPQTMNDKTLQLIGRTHSVNEVFNVYNNARDFGFNNINMDTILALPGEDLSDVENTYRQLKTLAPDSITAHTLAVKRASALKEKQEYINATSEMTEDMLDIADSYVREMGQTPYYMYRQKNSVGNFENVGYAKDGYECVYNVLIMEECQSIYAAGAGAVTKIVDKTTNRIERVFNVKNVEEYIKRRIDGRK